MSTDLITPEEKREFKKLDTAISKGMATFLDVGRALMEINQRKLYRDEYKTFEIYAKQRHELSRTCAYQLIDAAEMNEDLSAIADTLPKNEGQYRELSHVPQDNLGEVWKEVCDHSEESGDKVTAKLIRHFTEPWRGQVEEDAPKKDKPYTIVPVKVERIKKLLVEIHSIVDREKLYFDRASATRLMKEVRDLVDKYFR